MVRNWSERQIKDCIYNWNSILLHAYRGPIFASPCPLSMSTVQLFWLYLGVKTIQRNVKFHACNFAATLQGESIGRQLIWWWWWRSEDESSGNFFTAMQSFAELAWYTTEMFTSFTSEGGGNAVCLGIFSSHINLTLFSNFTVTLTPSCDQTFRAGLDLFGLNSDDFSFFKPSLAPLEAKSCPIKVCLKFDFFSF